MLGRDFILISVVFFVRMVMILATIYFSTVCSAITCAREFWTGCRFVVVLGKICVCSGGSGVGDLVININIRWLK